MKHFLFCLIGLFIAHSAFADDRALELIKKLEKNSRGETFSGDLAMTITQRGNSRAMTIRFWSKGRDHALIRILSPARDKGTGNLRVNTDLWQYLPRVNKTIKIPSSMLFQSWMGSDFSNDDLVKSSSLEKDYNHVYVGEEKVEGNSAVKIECTPKPDAKIVWGKVIVWVSPKEGALYRQDFYTEAGKLIKQLKGYQLKTYGKYTIPTRMTMQDFSKKESLTELVYSKVEFDSPLSTDLFTQKELEKSL
jgi:outer membrane lipoprotein-sorting protein